MNAKIIPAQVSDLDVLNQISISAKMYWNYPAKWVQKWKPYLIIDNQDFKAHTIFKSVVNHEIIGFCMIEEKPSTFEIAHLWIVPDRIGQGYGRQLLEFCLNYIIPTDKEIEVEADPHAESFYARFGFVTYSQVESYPPGRFLPLMRKSKNMDK